MAVWHPKTDQTGGPLHATEKKKHSLTLHKGGFPSITSTIYTNQELRPYKSAPKNPQQVRQSDVREQELRRAAADKKTGSTHGVLSIRRGSRREDKRRPDGDAGGGTENGEGREQEEEEGKKGEWVGGLVGSGIGSGGSKVRHVIRCDAVTTTTGGSARILCGLCRPTRETGAVFSTDETTDWPCELDEVLLRACLDRVPYVL
jgi:hypothetical protein